MRQCGENRDMKHNGRGQRARKGVGQGEHGMPRGGIRFKEWADSATRSAIGDAIPDGTIGTEVEKNFGSCRRLARGTIRGLFLGA